MDKYGVVDIGSNTVRLEIYNVDENFIELFFKKKEFLGLAGYVEDGVMERDGILKTIEVLKDYISICQNIGTKDLYIFATAAIRNAKNALEIIDEVEKSIGHKIDLISGEKEAELGFRAVTDQFGIKSGLNIDIGGGSTEVSVYKNGTFQISKSLTDGALSFYSQYVELIFPTKKELARMEQRVDQYIVDERLANITQEKITGVGGTIRMLNRLIASYYGTDTENIIKVKKLRKIYDLILSKDKDVIKLILRLAPERIHLIIPGTLILLKLCDHYNVKEILVSESGVRAGYLSMKLEDKK